VKEEDEEEQGEEGEEAMGDDSTHRWATTAPSPAPSPTPTTSSRTSRSRSRCHVSGAHNAEMEDASGELQDVPPVLEAEGEAALRLELLASHANDTPLWS